MHPYSCRNGHGQILLVGDEVSTDSIEAATQALAQRTCPLCPAHAMPGLGGYCECCSVVWDVSDEGGVHVSGVHLLVSNHV